MLTYFVGLMIGALSMAISQSAINRLLSVLALSVLPALAISSGDCVYCSSFEAGPDVEGPTIQIVEPESWVESQIITVIFEDESGLAARGVSGVSYGGDWDIYWEQPTVSVEEYTVSNLSALLGSGVNVTAIAQDIFGNYGRQTATFKAESAITPGTYVLAEPFESQAFSSELCSLGDFNIDNSTFQYKVNSIDVGISIADYYNANCTSGQPCVSIGAGSFVAKDIDGNETSFISGGGSGILRDFEKDLEFSGQPTYQETRSGSAGTFTVGASASGVFTTTNPQEIIAEVTFYCSNQYMELTCTEGDSGCVSETYGPFTVQAKLQAE